MKFAGVFVPSLLLSFVGAAGGLEQASGVGPDFVEKVRSVALGYVAGLPNFVCTQKIRRYVIFELDHRAILDEVVSEMAFYDGAEHAKVLTVGGRPASGEDLESLAGLTSRGEFGVSLAALFDPQTNAVFENDGTEKINGRQTIRLRYFVPLESSRNQISLGGVAVVTAYRGRCWIDPATFQVVRLEDMAVDIPSAIPVSASSSRTDYDQVEIAGRSYWLPVSASVRVLAESKPGAGIYNFYGAILGKNGFPNFNPRKAEAINTISFEDYHKFEAEVSVSF